MKKFYSFSIMLFFLGSNLYSSQPAEQGLIFGHTYGKQSKNQEAMSSGPVGVRKSVLGNARSSMTRKTVNPIKQKRSDGSYSNVFQVEDLQQFLHLATREKRPLVIKIVSPANQQFIEFQELADQLKDSAIFVSMDASKNHTTIKLLLLILRSEGADLTDRQIRLPLFLLSKNGFVVLQKGLVNFQKNNLKFLNEGNVGKSELEKSILQALRGKNSKIAEEKKYGVSEEIFGKRSKILKYWEKLKNWMRSKF